MTLSSKDVALVPIKINGHSAYMFPDMPEETITPPAQPKRAVEKRWRGKIVCWLSNNADDISLYHWLQDFKQTRRFTATIRNALRLYRSLSIGDTSVLIELFPGIVDKLQKPDDSANVDLQALITMLAQNGANQSTMPSIDVTELAPCFVEEVVDPSIARNNFSAGLGDLFGDDDENELWN